MSRRQRRWLRGAGAVAALVGLVYVAAIVSPWPRVLLIRWFFARGAAQASAALEPHVPHGLAERLNLHYDGADPDALLDVFQPSPSAKLPGRPTLVWIHGGAWVSGSKNGVANYLRVLAGKGYGVVGVDYTVAPEATYPTPIRQINRALTYLKAHASELELDASHFVLLGDSAGAQLAAQLAAMTTSPAYAHAVGVVPSLQPTELRGVVLYCGAFNARAVHFDGPFGPFLTAVLWAYTGERDFLRSAKTDQISVAYHLTPEFPASFISAGNADPLLPQSRELEKKLSERGVRVDSLFFASEHQPPLGHEYQLNLDSAAGKLALERSLAFLSTLVDQH